MFILNNISDWLSQDLQMLTWRGCSFSRLLFRRKVSSIVMHSKYFPFYDWLKPRTYFTITSCCSPNLEKNFVILNQWCQKCSPLQIIEWLTEERWLWVGLGCLSYLSFFSTGSTRNKAAFAVVAEAVIDDFGGQDQCPWSPAQLRGTFSLLCILYTVVCTPYINFSYI